jgi:hypothetical protein
MGIFRAVGIELETLIKDSSKIIQMFVLSTQPLDLNILFLLA